MTLFHFLTKKKWQTSDSFDMDCHYLLSWLYHQRPERQDSSIIWSQFSQIGWKPVLHINLRGVTGQQLCDCIAIRSRVASHCEKAGELFSESALTRHIRSDLKWVHLIADFAKDATSSTLQFDKFLGVMFHIYEMHTPMGKVNELAIHFKQDLNEKALIKYETMMNLFVFGVVLHIISQSHLT